MQWVLPACPIVPHSSSAVKAFEVLKAIRRSSTHVVHLVSDILHPSLTRLYALDHQCKFGTYDRLRVKGLLESDTLIGPPDVDSQQPDLDNNTPITDLRHSSTTTRCAPKLVAATIHRS